MKGKEDQKFSSVLPLRQYLHFNQGETESREGEHLTGNTGQEQSRGQHRDLDVHESKPLPYNHSETELTCPNVCPLKVCDSVVSVQPTSQSTV